MNTVDTFSVITTDFDRYFSIATPVAFNPEWKNGTGYLDYACLEDFGHGRLVSFTDDNNRRGIAITVKGKSVVIFERHTNGVGGVFVYNAPGRRCSEFQLEGYCSSGRLEGSALDNLVKQLIKFI